MCSAIVSARRKPPRLGSCRQGERGTVPSRLVSLDLEPLSVVSLNCGVQHVTFHITNHVYVVALSPAHKGREGCAARRDGHGWTYAALLFQPVRADRGANDICGYQQHILHPGLRGVDDGAAHGQTNLQIPLLEARRTHVSLAAGDGLHVVLDGWIWK